MKVKELMIGDWVLSRSDDKIHKIDSIITLDDGTILFAIEDGLHFDYMCEPIPLTAEILEKNGFGYDEVHDVYQLHTMDYIIVEVGIYHPDFINIGYRQCTPDGINEGNISSICKVDGSDLHVHELQHALRLCGVGKDIII